MHKKMRSIFLIAATAVVAAVGCEKAPPKYGVEDALLLPNKLRQTWAVAPAANLSGTSGIDPLIQADLLYKQLQTVEGLTVIPVNRTVEVMAALRIDKINSREQAALVADMLGAQAVIVPTVTIYDPYNPPKMGASLQLFEKPDSYRRPQNIDPRELARLASPGPTESLPQAAEFLQAVGMFDAANGSVRERLSIYADGRNDPLGPLGAKEYIVSMDRYTGFVYHELIDGLLMQMKQKGR
jgi:hypothetical protein